ncbi:MAG: flagellar basal body rod protein FlgB [Nitrospinae bacterium]|nr:flagellar basal body rod protein FlgB [Nitrospinota bacterium]
MAKRAITLNARQAAISAANISNAETPGYKALKFEFESALQEAVSGNSFPMRGTNIRHLANPAGDVSSIQGITDADLSRGRIDGNNVNLDREVVKFSQAQISYDAVIAAFTGRNATMKSAITDAK